MLICADSAADTHYFHAELAQLTDSLFARKFVPIGSTVVAEAWTESVEGRKVKIKFTVRSLDGETLHNDGSSLFIDTNKGKAAKKEA